jgi:peptide/nickel transport system substrate-binding protein
MGHDRHSVGTLTRRQILKLAAITGVTLPLLEGGLLEQAIAGAVAEKRGGTLNVGIGTDIVSLDPNDIVFANVPMFYQVYNYLVKFTPTLQARPDLAESWEVAPDGMSVVFRVRQGVKTHSGGNFDADALLANFRRTKDRTTGGGLFSRLADWTSAEKLDSHGVRFRLARPRADYLAQVGRWGMVDPAAFANVKQRGGGTGPYRVEEWVPGDHLTMTRFADYWQPGVPLLDRIIFRIYSDPQAMENAFRAGQIDIAHTVPNKDVGRLRAAGYNVIPAPVPNEYYILVINTKKPPFDNIKVRQAFQHVVDRATISRTILGGVGKPLVQPVAPNAPGYDPKLDTELAFDLAKAKQMLAAAGFPNGFKTAILCSTSTPETPQVAQVIQADLKKLGIDAGLNIMEPSAYFPPYFAGNFELSVSFLTLATIDPTEFTISSAYRTNETNPSWIGSGPPREYVDFINKINASFNRQERWNAMKAAVRYILEQSWVVPVAMRLPTYGLGKAVRGFSVDPQMIMSLRTTWLDK